MPYEILIHRTNKSKLTLMLDAGDVLFVLGPNGCGKTTLMQVLFNNHFQDAHRILANRQTWIAKNEILYTPEGKRNTKHQIRVDARAENSRWLDKHAASRPAVALHDLVDKQNALDRQIAAAFRANDLETASEITDIDTPVSVINELLADARIPISISIDDESRVWASKSGSEPYTISRLSDGERNALFMVAETLTVAAGKLIIIDEPERHLHRSIITPLIAALVGKRPDCAFVVSTHELALPSSTPGSSVLLVRACAVEQSGSPTWDVDYVGVDADLSEDVKTQILGPRRKALFVEGVKNGLDERIYELLLPDYDVIAVGHGCRRVMDIVRGIRAANDINWVSAHGLIDNDRRTEHEIAELRDSGINVLPVFDVESVYYSPRFLDTIAMIQAEGTDSDAKQLKARWRKVLLEAVSSNRDYLCAVAVEKRIRRDVAESIPTLQELQRTDDDIHVAVPVRSRIDEERARLDHSLAEADVDAIIRLYPLRKSGALNPITQVLGFSQRALYEGAVRRHLRMCPELHSEIRQELGIDHLVAPEACDAR